MISRSSTILVVVLLLSSAGCGEGDSAASSSAKKTKAETTGTTAGTSGTSQASEESFEDLLVGLDLPENIKDLERVFTTTRDTWRKDPENGRKATRFVDLLARVGQLHEESGTKEQSVKTFQTAERLMKEAKEKGFTVDPVLESILTFHLACIKAEENDAATSLTMLSKAVELGFPDLAQIKEKKALESVRALPNFAETMTAWEKTQRERTLEAGRAAIVNGESFPFTFDLKDVEGNPIRLSDYKGKVCIVDIWGTWCGPCVMEIPSFIKLQNEFAERGFQMIGLNKENSPPEAATPMVRQFISTHGINYPCALIDERILRQIPQLEGYPTTLFIDHEGKVRAKLVGVHPHETLESMVLALIEERDSAAASTPSN